MTGDSKGRRVRIPFAHQQAVRELLASLVELASKADEDNGNRSKDALAFSALFTAGALIKFAAGWALEHECGLAERGLGFMPPVTEEVTKLPAYAEKQSKVDDPGNEVRGAELMKENKAFHPAIARQMLINILKPLHELFPPGL